MNRYHEVKAVSFDNNRMRLEVDGREYVFDLTGVSQRLLHASAEERRRYEISASGYGIHWPLIDEDLSIDALLGIEHVRPEFAQHPQRKTETPSM